MKTLGESILAGRKSAIQKGVHLNANIEMCKDLIEVLLVRKFICIDEQSLEGKDKDLSIYSFRYIDLDGRSFVKELTKEIGALYKKYKIGFIVDRSSSNVTVHHYFDVATNTKEYQEYGINYPKIEFSSTKLSGITRNFVKLKAPSGLIEIEE